MTTPETPLHVYLEAARRRLVALQGSGESGWSELIDRAFGDAHARGDVVGLSRAVQFLVNLLEGEGRFDDALAEVESALQAASSHPAARTPLLALKGALLVARGEVATGLELADEATAAEHAAVPGEGRIKTLVLCDVIRLQALVPEKDLPGNAFGEAVEAGATLDQLFELSWLVPYHAAFGQPLRARPLIRRMRALAREQNAAFREADVLAFEHWSEAVARPAIEVPALPLALRVNALANWRATTLGLFGSLSRRDWPAAPDALSAHALAARSLRSEHGDEGVWGSLAQVLCGGAAPKACPLPPPITGLTLSNLPAAMAGAYLAALTATGDEAVAWLQWATRVRRRGIQSCLELPVSLHRIEALLALRTGRAAVGRRKLDEAARWCAENGYGAEGLLARLQSLELQRRLFGSDVAGVLAEASVQLLALGVDPVPHRYAVGEALAAPGARPRAALLTPGETGVLRQLATGCTYKESAQALGLSWRTVQTVAHNAYQKLGVMNRTHALEEARRLGLL